MEEIIEKELPEIAESTETDENRLFSTETDVPSNVTEETEETDENRQKPTIFDNGNFRLGVLVGALGAGFLAAVAIVLILCLRPEPPVEIRTVTETVYVTVEATEPTLPPPEANPMGPEDFVRDENGYMICTARPYVMGIDVSTYQKEVDWAQVKAAGVEFVMIRAAYRGYGNGAVLEDELVRTHYEGAAAAGLKVGFYFFSQAISTREAVAEAEFLLDVIDGWQVDMPIVFDWEYISNSARTAGVGPRILTDCAIAFCERIKAAGYEPMVYFNANQSRRDMYLAELTDYKFWLAMYSDEMTYEYRVDMWQYTQTGRVPGIDVDVDINLYFPPN